MTEPNPLHGAIDETQPHSATEGGVCENPTMREALEAMLADCEAVCKNSYETWDGGKFIWNDDVWREADPETFALAQQARAALAAEEESGWRTMDSAPKDGTCVLGFVAPHATLPVVMFWSDEYNEWQDEELAIFRRKPESGVRISLSPTHWRPLPPPPSSKDEP